MVLSVLPAPAEPRDGPAAVADTTVTVGLIADVQYCDCEPKGTRYYRDSLTKLADAAAVLNGQGLDLTIQLGDIIDRYERSFDEILPVYDLVDEPRYHVLGNHDFPLPSDEVVARLGMPGQYYELSQGAWRFVVLDTNEISLYANEVGSADYQRAQRMLEELRAAGAPNAQSFNGAVGRRQLNWLRSVLSDSRAAGQRVLVFGHMPIHGSSLHNAWDDKAIRRALQASGNVAAYLNGHNHAGAYALRRGIHYLNLQGMVEVSPTSNAYAVLHLGEDALTVDGFDREPDRLLALTPLP